MKHYTNYATGIGFIAILLWSSLALFTSQARAVPPLLLLSLTFGSATLLFLIAYFITGEIKNAWRHTPKRVMLMGGLSFFFYHFCYFYAFQHIPPVEAGLIAYLWPLLIVVLSGIAQRQLRWPHIMGAFIAFSGTAIMLQTKTQHGASIEGDFYGYGAAFACALIWSCYSVANRRFQSVPSGSVLWYCLITTLLAGLAHTQLEAPHWHFPITTWVAIFMLGLGPVGIAFFCWDTAVKHGNLSLLGVLSYLAPALSTLWLGIFTSTSVTPVQYFACLLITVGALFSSLMPTRKANTSISSGS